MRQLRSKPCQHQRINLTCTTDHSSSNEEQGSFQPGWVINETEIEYSSSISNAFIYKSSGGGYVYEYRGRLSDLQTNLSKLHQLKWIDHQTRSVIIQLSLYNPNVQLFTSFTLLIELLSTGGILSTARFETFYLQREFCFSSFWYIVKIYFIHVLLDYFNCL